jgi:transposase
MSNFEELKQRAKDAVESIADKSIELYKAAEEKTKLLARTTKISAEITMEKGSLRRLYREIGQKYYEAHKDAPEPSLEQLCTEVTTTLARISAKQREIEDLRETYEAGRQPDDGLEDIQVEIILEDDAGCPEEKSPEQTGAADTSGQPEAPETPESAADTDGQAARPDNITEIPPPPFKM